jgi:uncharacterized protein YkwD
LGACPVKATPPPSDPWHVRVKLVRVMASWLATLTVLAGLTVAAAPAAHADTGSEEALFLSLTNSLRSSLGIQSLTPQSQLTSIARSWSAQMAAAGGISHNPSLPNQVTANWTQLGENVGMGGTVEAIQTAFINSPHHYENLANGAYNFVGIGVIDSNGTIYVTVDFMAAPASSGAAPAPRATAPRTTSPPRSTTPAAPRVTAPRAAAPATTAPPSTAPPPPATAPAPEPVAVKGSAGLDQVLAQLRSVDASN